MTHTVIRISPIISTELSEEIYNSDELFMCDICHNHYAEYNLDFMSGPYRECWFCWWDEGDDYD